MVPRGAEPVPIMGEARLRIDGGLAHFPGLAREHTIPFDRLDVSERDQVSHLAQEADFFDRTATARTDLPDGRVYTLTLAIDGRARELRVAEPIVDPALASLIALVRRLTRQGAAH